MAELIALWKLVFFWFAVYSAFWWARYCLERYEKNLEGREQVRVRRLLIALAVCSIVVLLAAFYDLMRFGGLDVFERVGFLSALILIVAGVMYRLIRKRTNKEKEKNHD